VDKFFAQLLAPFLLLAMLAVAIPIKLYLKRHMRDGWLKRLLLRRIGGSDKPKQSRHRRP
jgi:hypothetical protein